MTIAEKITRAKQDIYDAYNAGYKKGQAEAGGYDKGYADGIEQGKQSEYDRFWDEYQNYGKRTDNYLAFSYKGWNDNTFNPKYPIICKGTSTSANNVFTRTAATRIPVMVTIEGVPANSTFYYATNLTTISLLVLNGVTSFSNCFVGCSKLENLTIEGRIDVSINISATAVLSKASIESIINVLSTTTSGLTVTLSKTAVNNAFETAEGLADGSNSEEWLALIATKQNWTISLA